MEASKCIYRIDGASGAAGCHLDLDQPFADASYDPVCSVISSRPRTAMCAFTASSR